MSSGGFMLRVLCALLLLGAWAATSTAGFRTLGQDWEYIEGPPTDSTTSIDTTQVFDLTGSGRAAFALEATCDSLKLTVQIAIGTYGNNPPIDGYLTWINAPGITWPIQINGDPLVRNLHVPPRALYLLPYDGTISADDSPSWYAAPYIRAIIENNDASHDQADLILFRLFVEE